MFDGKLGFLKKIAPVFFFFCLLIQTSSTNDIRLKMAGSNPKLPLVAIVTTGGTIAEKTDINSGGAVPAVSGEDLVTAVPGLSKVANIGVYELCNIDSSQMSPEIWSELSEVVNQLLGREEITGVVVTHGTDTMAEGAYFVDLTTNSEKPVVFTGAMNNASSQFPDGLGNLMNAVVQAASHVARGWGVTVTLNCYINSARDVRKTQTVNVQTFMSGEKGYLGYVDGFEIIRINKRLYKTYLSLPTSLPKVVYISTYAGADGSLVKYAVDSGAVGLVIDGVGAGNVNEATYGALKYAMSKGVMVVVSSRVYYGRVVPVYGGNGGGKTLQDDGCILAGDLSGQKARLLLMLGIAEYGRDVERIRKLFGQ